MKKLDIIIPKCDCVSLPFIYKLNGEVCQLKETDLIYFSVKRNLLEKEYLIQKSLNDGIIYNSEAEKYFIEINYEDTVNLNMNDTYLYDLVIYYDGNKPSQKLYGTFQIGPKVTLNEVV